MTDRNDTYEPADDSSDAVAQGHGGPESPESDVAHERGPAPPAGRKAAGRAPRRAPRREPYETHEKPAKSPMLAAFLGVVPGLGNIYNGLYSRGFIFFLLVISLFYTAIESGEGPHLALLIPSIVFAWLFNIFDGYRQATLINWGWDEEDEAAAAARQGSGALAAGVALFGIGVYGFLHQFFDIDLSVLADHSYVIFLGVGGWLIYQAWGDKKDEPASSSY